MVIRIRNIKIALIIDNDIFRRIKRRRAITAIAIRAIPGNGAEERKII